MARFDFLELGGPSPDDQGRQDASLRLARDETDWLRQADTHRRRGQYENALRFYSRALEDNKSLVVAWVGQVQMLIFLEELPEADLWARKALEIFPGNGELMAARGQALCRLGDRKQSLAACDAAMVAQGRSAYRWQVRGELMLATGQTIDSHCFDKAQQLDADWLVPLESALIYLRHDVASCAQVRARVAVEKAADQYYAWYVAGRAHLALNFRRLARESFEQCLKLCPQHAEAEAQLARLRGRGLAGLLGRWFHRG